MLLRHTLAALALLATTLAPHATHAQQAPLTFLGELDIADKSVEIDGTTVGGLSGAAYDAKRGVYYVICDDRGDFGPPRFYTLRIVVGLDGVRDVQVLGVTTLDADADTPGIQPYDQNQTDTEEIVLLPDDTLLISSERDRNNVPWLRRFALDGSLLNDVVIPDAFIPQGSGAQQTRGVRSNLGFEGVTLAPDEGALYVMNEEALAQDGPISTPTAGTIVRLLRYSFSGSSGTPRAQFAYRTDKIFAAPVPADQFADNGVSALLFVRGVIPGYDFIDLERSFSTGNGNDVALYGIRITGAEDVSSIASLANFSGRTVEKTLLANMSALGIVPDNLEGLVLGPRLPDGRQSLLLISDDNFADTQTNQFLLFAINAPAGK